MQETITQENLKLALKDAIVEALTEQRELVYSLMVEALEDIALAEAIREGLQSGEASREEVFQILQGHQGEGQVCGHICS